MSLASLLGPQTHWDSGIEDSGEQVTALCRRSLVLSSGKVGLVRRHLGYGRSVAAGTLERDGRRNEGGGKDSKEGGYHDDTTQQRRTLWRGRWGRGLLEARHGHHELYSCQSRRASGRGVCQRQRGVRLNACEVKAASRFLTFRVRTSRRASHLSG